MNDKQSGGKPVTLAPLVQRPSPNYSSRRGARVTHVVWHATIGAYNGAVRWLCTPTVYNADGSVKSGPDASAHCVLREDGGQLSQLVPLAQKAWHAEAFNSFSVGVEHASLSNGFASSAQMMQSARLFAWLCHRYRIPPIDGLHRPSGLVMHRQLGIAGGGHHDGPTDDVWHEYLQLVQHEVARGSFRRDYLR